MNGRFIGALIVASLALLALFGSMVVIGYQYAKSEPSVICPPQKEPLLTVIEYSDHLVCVYRYDFPMNTKKKMRVDKE